MDNTVLAALMAAAVGPELAKASTESIVPDQITGAPGHGFKPLRDGKARGKPCAGRGTGRSAGTVA